MKTVCPNPELAPHPRVSMKVGSFNFEVPFHDVDALGLVWHGHYLKYFEYARTRLFQDLNLGGEISKKFPYMWVVVDSRVKHTSPLRFEDKVRVEARLVDINYRVHLAYLVRNLSTDKVAAKGHTMLATLDAAGELIIPTPAVLVAALSENDTK